MGITFGSGGAKLTGSQMAWQTGSSFSATRSVVFAGDRIVLASMIGIHKTETSHVPVSVFELLSLDARTGQLKDQRVFEAYASLPLFATDDEHVIVAGRSVLRLTSDLKDDGSFDYQASGHKLGRIQNVSPDGSTLGNATSPGYELVDSNTLIVTPLTNTPLADTSVSNNGVITDNVHWIRDYPKDSGFVTYYDSSGDHLLYHGKCGGRPQFLTDDLILEPGCKSPLIIDTKGNVVRTIALKDAFSYAGVSQNGKRFALQVASFTGMHDLKHEKFVIYSVDSGEPITELTPEGQAEEQSWTAFSPDGTMFVVGSPLKLTLYRLP
jgi:hypothetical protein